MNDFLSTQYRGRSPSMVSDSGFNRSSNMSALLGGLISGAGSLASGIIGAANTNKANKRSIEFAKWSQQQQERFAWDMFRAENAYNTPEAQAERLVRAGLNPALMYGSVSGSTGEANGGQSISPANADIQPVPSFLQNLVGSAPFENLSALLEMQKTKAEIQKIGGETRQIDALIENTTVQTEIGRLNAENLRIKNVWLPKKEALAVRKATEEITEIVNKANLAASESNYKEALAILADADYSLKKQSYLFNSSQYPQIIANLKKQYEVMESEEQKNKATAYQATQTGNYMGQLKLTEQQNTRLREIAANLEDAAWMDHRNEISFKVEQLRKSLGLMDKQSEMLQKELERATKENNLVYARFIIQSLCQIAGIGLAVYGAGKGMPAAATNPLPYTGAGPWTPMPTQPATQPFIYP